MLKTLKEQLQDVRKRYKNRRETPQYWEFSEANIGYIQIPKVASRSMRKAFSDAYGIGSDDEVFDKFEDLYSAHVKHEEIRKAVDRGVYVFAFVCDPLARLYSAWMNKVSKIPETGRRCIFSCHGIDYGMPFADFAKRVCEIDDTNLDRHLRSQAWFLADEKGLIPQYIGKLETFALDYEHIRNKFPKLLESPHANKSVYEKKHLDAYDDITLKLVVERYRRDFDLFGYTYPSQ